MKLTHHFSRVACPCPLGKERPDREGSDKETNPWSICVVPGTLITAKDGIQVPIENIKEGDEVITHKGRPRKVVQVMKREYDGEICVIEVSGLPRELKVTPEHPILSLDIPKFSSYHGRRSRGSLESSLAFRSAGEIKQYDSIHTPSLSYEFPPSNIDEETASYLGIYAAEGFVYGTDQWSDWYAYRSGPYRELTDPDRIYGYRNVFALNKYKDTNLKKFIYWFVQDRFPDARIKVRGDRQSDQLEVVDVNHRILSRECVTHCGSGALNKRLSSSLMSVSPAIAKSFIAPFIRGDGCVYRRKNRDRKTKFISIDTASQNLAYQLFFLLDRAGIVGTMKKGRNKGGPTNRDREGLWKWNILISMSQAKALSQIMDEEFDGVFRRGQRFAGSACTYGRVRSISRELYKGSVYNIEVEEDNTYVADLCSVHNCTVSVGREDKERYEDCVKSVKKKS